MEKLTREEEARLYLENTSVSTSMVFFLLFIFLLIIFFVPVFQCVSEMNKRDYKQLQVLDIFKLNPTLKDIVKIRDIQSFLNIIPDPDDIKSYETNLEDNSYIQQALLPQVQACLTSVFKVGNEEVYIGEAQTLFYSKNIEYLTNESDTDAALKSIFKLNDFLKSRDIILIVFPVPSKVSIYPELFSKRYNCNKRAIFNREYISFISALKDNGVIVCDIGKYFKEAKSENLYLAQDTHWSPAGLDVAVDGLLKYIYRYMPAKDSSVLYVKNKKRVLNNGDIFDMLKLPDNQGLYTKQAVDINSVCFVNGEKLKSDESAEILLLGDSYTNIYSRKDLNWGEGAGLAEQLTYRLNTPVDVIAINAGGASASQGELYRELLRSKTDRLSGKKLVILEFAAREIGQGNWMEFNWSKINNKR